MTGVQTCALLILNKNVADREREFFIPSPDLEHRCKQKEKFMGINTVRLYICHHQIVGTSTGTFFSIFLDLGMKYYFLLSFLLDRFRFDFGFDSFLFRVCLNSSLLDLNHSISSFGTIKWNLSAIYSL